MNNDQHLLVSMRDAELLAMMLGEPRWRAGPDAEAASALADLLMEARLVPHGDLPADRVRINSRVTYEEQPGGARRTVVVAHPARAQAAEHRVSVVSPLGRALFGRQAGATVHAGAPGERAPSLRIVSSEPASLVERVVRSREVRGQFGFAVRAKHLVPKRPNLLLAKSHRGLHMLAPDEGDLSWPLRALRAAYGSSVQVETGGSGEPVLEMRVGLERRYVPEVRKELSRRNTTPSEEYVGVHYSVLRLEDHSAALLGLPDELHRLTSGKASLQIILTGYA